MACFVAPTTAAIITTGLRKKIPQKYHLEWLIMLLWGGSIVLTIDHISSGEIIASPPFLTVNSAKILPEILSTGILMIVAIVAVWIVMVLVANSLGKKPSLLSGYFSSIK